MNAPLQKKWRECKRCRGGFVQPIAEAPARLCPSCRASESSKDWDSTDEFENSPARAMSTETRRPRWTIESAQRELARRAAEKAKTTSTTEEPKR